MDPVVVSSISIVTPLLSLALGTLFGTIVGPTLTARLGRDASRTSFVRDQRRDAYTQFTVEVERVQRLADSTASGAASVPFQIADLDDLEFARVKIDLFGSHVARVWAYRCTLALIALEHAMSERPGSMAMIELPRAKLHEARTNLVRVLRVELGVSGQDRRDQVSRIEKSQTKKELRISRGRVNSDGHHAWLAQLPNDPGDMAVSKEALSAYDRAVYGALSTVRESPEIDDPGSDLQAAAWRAFPDVEEAPRF